MVAISMEIVEAELGVVEAKRRAASRQELLRRQRQLFEKFRSTPRNGKEIEHYSIPLILRPNVFWPYDDSVPLMDSVRINPGDQVLDVCTGSGVVAIFCALQGAGSVTALDWNTDAVSNAKENAILSGVGGIVDVRMSDMFEAVEPGKKFDLITANLPMMNAQARDVVESSIWDTDLRANNIFLSQVERYLKPGGRIYMTQADFAALDEVKALAKQHRWKLEQRNSKRVAERDTFFAFELTQLPV